MCIRDRAKGIKESKGRVHLHFGKNISESIENIENLAELIDREIITNYKLWPSNYISAHALGLIDTKKNFEGKENIFLKRFKDLDKTTLDKALGMYASPIRNLQKKG